MLRHERVATWSYPYEWSFEMLRDAALLQLALTRAALAEGITTKDASSYNVQFAGTTPCSSTSARSSDCGGGEPWPGYRQFCELFLNPLLVQALRDVPFQPLLRGSVHGIPPVVAADLLRGSGHLTKGVFTHVKLHARAERRYADADLERDLKAELKRAGFGPGGRRRPAEEPGEGRQGLDVGPPGVDVVGLLRPQPLRRGRPRGQGALRRRRRAAPGAARARPRRQRRPLLPARPARRRRHVVAVDSDDLVVDRLYRDLRAEGERRILPLVLDLSDPSPALGWRSRERPAFVDRVRPDLVLCLAVVHHLALDEHRPARRDRRLPRRLRRARSSSSSPTTTTRWRPGCSPAARRVRRCSTAHWSGLRVRRAPGVGAASDHGRPLMRDSHVAERDGVVGGRA